MVVWAVLIGFGRKENSIYLCHFNERIVTQHIELDELLTYRNIISVYCFWNISFSYNYKRDKSTLVNIIAIAICNVYLFTW